MATEVEWTPQGSTVPEVVLAEASCVDQPSACESGSECSFCSNSVGEESSHKQIRFLKMEGDAALFQV